MLLRLFGGPPRLPGPEAAAEAAEAALPGFVAADAVLGADGRAALVVGADGRLAVAVARRRRVRVSAIDWSALRSVPGGLLVEAPGPAGTLLAGVDALDVRRLARAGPV